MQTVLLTGASSGIGADLAALFAADGYRLVLVARRRERLAELGRDLERRHGSQWLAVDVDLADRAAPRAIFDRLAAEAIEVDVLVNNAGFGLHGAFAETSLERELEMIQVNIAALTELTKRALPGMRARGGGHILNLASTAAFQPGPFMAVYYASKAYVLSFSEALAEELSGTGVTVTALCPGPTVTGFQSAAEMSELVFLKKPVMMTSLEVARAGYEGMKKGKRLVIPGAMNKVLVQTNRVMPRQLVAGVVRRVQKP